MGRASSGPFLAIDSRVRVFVADRANNRIQLFDQEGKFLATWTQFGTPSGIFFDENDQIYVADSESDLVNNPGREQGIRIGDARTGWVKYFILGARPSNTVRAPSSALRAKPSCELRPFFAGGAGLLGACSDYSDTLLDSRPGG